MFYLDKIVVGPAAADAIDIDAPAETNVRAVAKALGKNTDDLTVCILDQLIALYEHITFTQGIAWGVELGKQLALKVTPAVGGDEAALAERDPSTQGLIRYYREQRS